MKKNNHQALDLINAFEKDFDMSKRETYILKNISSKTGFKVEKNIWRSKYWGKNLGASHWLGKYKSKNAVLKIQGVKPDTSESFMVSEFLKQNISKIVRPPILYKVLPWDDKEEYEAIISEYVRGKKVIVDGQIVTRKNIKNFLNYYQEYRKNCLPKKPWLPKPNFDGNWKSILDKLISTSLKAYPDSKLRSDGDFKLAEDAYKVLSDVYKDVDLEFMHGHFSCKDLIFENKDSNKVVIFSNLFWKWKFPFYDAIFAYHWFMYELAGVKNITPSQIESQRQLWLEEIYKVTGASESKNKFRLLNVALLERAVAGFIIDSFLIDTNKEVAKYLHTSTKNEAKRLIKELNNY